MTQEAKPTEERVTVAWCRGHKWWLPEIEIGQLCPEYGCGTDGRSNFHLVRRVGYLCAQGGLHSTKTEARSCQDDHI